MFNTNGYCDKCGILIKDSICEINNGVTYISGGHELCENCQREIDLIKCFNINRPNHIKIDGEKNVIFKARYCGIPSTKNLSYDDKNSKIYKFLTRYEFIYFNRKETEECISFINKTKNYWNSKTDSSIENEMKQKNIHGWGSELFRRLYKQDSIEICDRFLGYINSNEIYYLTGNDKQEMNKINEFFGFDILVISKRKRRHLNAYFKNKDTERVEDEKKESIKQDIANYRKELKYLKSKNKRNEDYIKNKIIEYSNNLKGVKNA